MEPAYADPDKYILIELYILYVFTFYFTLPEVVWKSMRYLFLFYIGKFIYRAWYKLKKPNVLEINAEIFNAWMEFIHETENTGAFAKPFYACVLRRIEESLKLYFINEKNPEDKSVLKQEFKKILSQDPYKTAIRNVDLNKITKKQKAISLLGRCGMSSLVWLLYK